MERKPNSDMLAIARKARRYTQKELAKELNITQSTLSKIEDGLLACSKEQLEKLVQILEFPEAFFTRSGYAFSLPITFDGGHFRKKQTVTKKDLDYIDSWYNIVSLTLLELLSKCEDFSHSMPSFLIEDYGNATNIASITRRDLQIPNGPIKNLTGILESLGIIIIVFDFENSKVDGFSSFIGRIYPVIFINSSLPADRQRFTLAHEFGHLVMHHTGFGYNKDIKEIEQQANEFASSFLMPEEDIKVDLENINIQKLISLKLRWRVSIQALLYRAKTLKLITDNQNKYFNINLAKAGYKKQEPNQFEAEKDTTFYELIRLYKEELALSNSEICSILKLFPKDIEYISNNSINLDNKIIKFKKKI